MSLSTEFKSVLPDIPQELLLQNSSEKTTLDMMREVSNGKSQMVTNTFKDLPRRVKEIVRLAGSQLSDTDMVNCNLFYRRGTLYHYRFGLRWLTDSPMKIARVSLIPIIFSGLQARISYDGINILCFNSRNQIVYGSPGLREDSEKTEAQERGRLLMGLGFREGSHEPYQLELVRDLATIFRHP